MSLHKIQVIVRFSDNTIKDAKLPLIKLTELSNRWLKQSVRQQNPSLSNKRLRFIHSGKVLTDSTNFIDEFLQLQRFSKSSLGSESNEQHELDRVFIIHCLIGDTLSVDELKRESELDNQVQEQSTTPAPIGFDRLANAGFSQEDIQNLRQQFRSLYGDLPEPNGENTDGSQGRDIRQLEERWIDSSVNEMDEFNTGNAGSRLGGNEDLLIGILIGCLLGVLSLFLLKEEQLFSKRQRMAVIAGFIVNFSFALVRQWA
ncbi:putative membrane protein [Wickerhamomyces ciferrii]|uniref:Membrane protein n=1 Tax=Wickerhamomyces ciferrii (strain ATCC 14091 / BCRC 22168 / CBS 111 / JCM 3599 / NBRC 0793 / NRRL Y-1031 F-60-10) TaxID=1206466 RepID=K0KMR6_WICCF|nr:uncharacterized protein BN7_3807 [Wickerhamomyces ciferrii]CCH44246.1 putative membrane protein [Wickerhamomyces ciferrii]